MTTALTTIDTYSELAGILPLDQHPAAVYLASLTSAASRRTMHSALNEVARLMGIPALYAERPSGQRAKRTEITFLSCNWQALRFQQTAALRAKLAAKYAPATANKMLSAVRGVLTAARRLGLISADECATACDIKTVKGETLPSGRELHYGEVQALAEQCKKDKTPAGARDAALIAVLYTCGLRRAELVALDLADLDRDTGKLTIRSGKGRKARTSYVTNGALTALQAWLVVRGLKDGALFVSIRKGGHMSAQGLTSQAVYNILKGRATQAGVKDFSPHDFRRTFVSEMLDRGADIVTVQKLAGHASSSTTARYDRRGEETKRKAASLLHFPF